MIVETALHSSASRSLSPSARLHSIPVDASQTFSPGRHDHAVLLLDGQPRSHLIETHVAENLEVQLRNLTTELSEKAALAELRDSEANMLQVELEKAATSSSVLSRALAGKEIRIQELTSAVDLGASSIAELEIRIAELSATLASKVDSVKSLTSTNLAGVIHISDRSHVEIQMQARIQALTKDMAAMELRAATSERLQALADERENEVKRLVADLNEATLKVEAKDLETKQLQGCITNLTCEMHNYKSSASKELKKVLEEKELMSKHLEAALDDAKNQIAEKIRLEAEQQTLRTMERKRWQESSEAKDKRITQLEKSVEELRQNLAAASKAAEEQKRCLETKLSEAGFLADELRTAVNVRDETVRGTQKQFEALRDKTAELAAQQLTVKEQTLLSDVQTKTYELRDAKGKLLEQNAELVAKQVEIGRLEEGLRERNFDVLKIKEELELQLSAVRANLAAKEIERAHLDTRILELQGECNAGNARLAEAHSSLEFRNAEARKASDEVLRLQQMLQHQSALASTSEAKVQSLTAQLAASTAMVTSACRPTSPRSRAHSPQARVLSPRLQATHQVKAAGHIQAAGRFPVGHRVEYYSASIKQWIPAVVLDFDPLSDSYRLDVKSTAPSKTIRETSWLGQSTLIPGSTLSVT